MADPVDDDRLQAILDAMAALPDGPWEPSHGYTDSGARFQSVVQDASPYDEVAGEWGLSEDVAKYLALLDPPTVRAVIDELRRTRLTSPPKSL